MSKLLLNRDVSRETIAQLEIYSALLLKWTKTINLIAPNTMKDVWTRHIEDSAQVYFTAPTDWKTWLDLGSGGGLPALVVAILDVQRRPMTLIETDKRKCVFLRTAARELGLPVTILSNRIEDSESADYSVISARALADLNRLLDYTKPFMSDSSVGLFQKGRRWQDEVAHAQNSWDFVYDAIPSEIDQNSVILKVSGLKRRES